MFFYFFCFFVFLYIFMYYVDFSSSPMHTMTGEAPRTYSIRACWAPSAGAGGLACARALAPDGLAPVWHAPMVLDCVGEGFSPRWQEMRRQMENMVDGQESNELLDLAEEQLLFFLLLFFFFPSYIYL